jgi:hypothetical protein
MSGCELPKSSSSQESSDPESDGADVLRGCSLAGRGWAGFSRGRRGAAGAGLVARGAVGLSAAGT